MGRLALLLVVAGYAGTAEAQSRLGGSGGGAGSLGRIEGGAGAVAAQSAAPVADDVLTKVEKRLIGIKVGFAAAALYRNGKDLDLGYFGGGARKIFAGVPDAIEQMSTFRTLRIVGMAMYAVGIGALLTDLVLLAVRSPAVYNSAVGFEPLYWVLLASGGAVGMLGGIIQQAANPYLSDAVRIYNKAVFDKARGNRLSLSVGAAPSGVAAFVSGSF